MSQILMSGADTAWYRMNKPYNQMSITGLLELRPCPEPQKIMNLLTERLLIYDRFTQRVSFTNDVAFWQDDTKFDIHNHVKEVSLSDLGFESLEDFVSDVMSSPFDESNPLWMIYLVKSETEDACTLVVKLHHSIADGIALIRVLLSLAKTKPDGEFFDPEKAYPSKNKLAKSQLRWSSGITNALIETGKVVSSLWKFVTMPKDTNNPVKGKLQERKRAVWSDLITLDRVKSTAKKHNVTINDLLLWVTCNALRAYFFDIQQLSPDDNIRITMPVNLRTGSESDKMGNRFGLVFIRLPIGEKDPIERLRLIRDEMDSIKKSREAIVAFGVLNVLGRTTTGFENFVVDFLSSKCTGVLTNVPGPRKQLYFAGSAISKIMFWVPKSGNLGLGISLFSYNNSVSLGIAVDEERVPDYKRLAQIFNKQIEEDIPKLS